MGDHATLGERYLIAAGSGRRCDADVLLAASWAARDPRRELGLALWRWQTLRQYTDLAAIRRVSEGLLNRHLAVYQRNSRVGRRRLTAADRLSIRERVLHWYSNGQVWGDEDDLTEHHHWLSDEYARCVRMVFADMAKRLDKEMELA